MLPSPPQCQPVRLHAVKTIFGPVGGTELGFDWCIALHIHHYSSTLHHHAIMAQHARWSTSNMPAALQAVALHHPAHPHSLCILVHADHISSCTACHACGLYCCAVQARQYDLIRCMGAGQVLPDHAASSARRQNTTGCSGSRPSTDGVAARAMCMSVDLQGGLARLDQTAGGGFSWRCDGTSDETHGRLG